MSPNDLVNVLENNSFREYQYYRDNPGSGFWRWGWQEQRERLAAVAKQCTSWQGDIVEIGCQEGLTSKLLCEVAQEHGRRFIAVDPWETGTQACEGGEYDKFLANTIAYKDLIDTVRLSSQSKEAIDYLSQRRLCFAFVDGLHTESACASDILAVSHSHCIVVDDILWSGDLMTAYMRSLGERPHIRHPYCREGYILDVQG